MKVRCFAISNRHQQGIEVEITSTELFPLAIDFHLSCQHLFRLNLEPSEPRFEIIDEARKEVGK